MHVTCDPGLPSRAHPAAMQLPQDPRELTPEVLLHAYRAARFPVGNRGAAGDQVHWPSPDPRAVIPLDPLRISRRILRRVPRFEITFDRSFEEVIRGCASRERTWLSDEIIQASIVLHRQGYAHSAEARRDGRLVGGVYGVALGGAFFAESMFHHVDDASKVALASLLLRLQENGFALADMQLINPLLTHYGVVEIPREEYQRRLAEALQLTVRW